MEYKKYIRIFSKHIVGIKHPQLIVEGRLIDDSCRIKLYVDDKEKKVRIMPINTIGGFSLISELNKDDKKIVLVIVKDGKESVIFKTTNNISRRIQFKISKILRKILVPFIEIGKGFKILWKEHHLLVPIFLWGKYWRRLVQKIRLAFHMEYYYPFNQKEYLNWISKKESKPVYEELKYKPLISVIIPVYNISREYLSECLDSILNQHYTNFEICLADDCSTLPETKDTLKEYVEKDKRIKVVYRKENGRISNATNSALEIATGEFVALMDNDDVIPENALYEFVYVLNRNRNIDMIYSDEDKIDMEGLRCEPHFKPDYSPDSLLGGNYICHFEILRRSIVNKIGGFRSEYDGAQDFDLFLRFVEQTTDDKIYHIPKILYHWRKVLGSTADTIENKDYAIENGKKAVEDSLKRRRLKSIVTTPIKSTQYLVEYKYDKEPLVSIIIPTRDRLSNLQRCIQSIYDKTTYKNFEILIVNNGSKEKSTFNFFDQCEKKYKSIRIIDVDGEFNFSKINNIAAKAAKGEYLLFLNNDTEVITPTWITSMVGYAMQKHIGAVGVKLLYPNGTIQHGGVVLGINGTACHAFLHLSSNSFGFYGRLLVPYDYSAVTAACMIIKKKKFEEVAGFDENLKVAFNDVDLCLKLLDKKYYNVFLPQVELIHYESLSRGLDTTANKYHMFLDEKSYLQNHWKKYLDNDKFYNPNFSSKYVFMLDKKK